MKESLLFLDDIVRIFDKNSEKDLLWDICAKYSRKYVTSCGNEVMVKFFPSETEDFLESSGLGKPWKVSVASVAKNDGTVSSSFCMNKPLLPPRVQCDAVEKSKGTSRIFGGTEALAYSWPWLVRFPRAGCGGTIVSPHWVLTAAHCCSGLLVDQLFFVAMDHNQYYSEAPELSFLPDYLEIHPQYDPSIIRNDLCMIHTANEIPVFSNSLTLPPETACLPEQDSEEELGKECFIAGWGLKNQQGDTAMVLQEAGVPILDHQTCVNWYRESGVSFLEKQSYLCAGYLHGGTDSCRGDSGGPLICVENNRPVLRGVTSWGIGCAEKKRPGVYARVSSYREWIDECLSMPEPENGAVMRKSPVTEEYETTTSGESASFLKISVIYLNLMIFSLYAYLS
ncbi:unnamed protein product [Oikopleura dioica]|uniref:Peptidase S1 domain-containing protein n=1 Tax=Oikopleura dioica TaxID=34765 RepID=E4Y9Y8_OIKDI|nr:unnamed protein product [Oikopleura dioica]